MARTPYHIPVFKGLDNKNPPESLVAFDLRAKTGEAFATAANNVDFLATGGVSRRRGWSLAQAGNFNSLWVSPASGQAFAVKGGVAGTLSSDLTFTSLTAVAPSSIVYADTGAGVYFSDGRSMWRYYEGAATIRNQVGTYSFGVDSAGSPIRDLSERPENFDAPPPATVLTYMFGRLWVGNSVGVFFSRPYMPDQFNLMDDFLDIPNVTMIAKVGDGYFLGSDTEVFYINGGNPKQPTKADRICDFGVYQGTAVEAPLRYFDGKSQDLAVLWESERGKVLGKPGGSVELLTEARVAYPNALSGASFLRELNGQLHHVTALASPSTDGSNMRTSDTAEAQIIRNGVLIT